MDADFAKRWAADLRNPENQQTTGRLFDGRGYCCLGRACIVAGMTFVHEKVRTDEGLAVDPTTYVADGTQQEDGSFGASEALPLTLSKEIGMYLASGYPRDDRPILIDGIAYDSLAEANDRGVTFAKLADFIEQNYERL